MIIALVSFSFVGFLILTILNWLDGNSELLYMYCFATFMLFLALLAVIFRKK